MGSWDTTNFLASRSFLKISAYCGRFLEYISPIIVLANCKWFCQWDREVVIFRPMVALPYLGLLCDSYRTQSSTHRNMSIKGEEWEELKEHIFLHFCTWHVVAMHNFSTTGETGAKLKEPGQYLTNIYIEKVSIVHKCFFSRITGMIPLDPMVWSIYAEKFDCPAPIRDINLNFFVLIPYSPNLRLEFI